jgi:hypothetical protein
MLMTRARILAASLVVGGAAAGLAYAQQGTIQPPPMELVLAGKQFTPPLRGVADVEFLPQKTKRDGRMVVTTFQVRNASNGPIARLQIDETWYDKGGNVVTGGRGLINGVLAPGEQATIVIETPYNSAMLSNNYNFSHANGTVKPEKVNEFPEPPEGTPAPTSPSN